MTDVIAASTQDLDTESRRASLIVKAIDSDLALNLPPDLSFEEWAALGRHLHKFARGSAWWLGDWLLYGEHGWGDKYNQAVEVTGIGADTLVAYQWTASRIPAPDRRRELSFTHHREVAGVEDLSDRLDLLDRAVDEGWSAQELRQAVRALKAIPADTSPSSSSDADDDSGDSDPVPEPRREFTVTVAIPETDATRGEVLAEMIAEAWQDRLRSEGIPVLGATTANTRKG